MTTAAIPFPEHLPARYQWLDDEPIFDPARHLALESPKSTCSLSELGYSDDEIQCVASPIAASSPFRVMSAEGAAVLLQTARRLREHRVSCERINNMVRGGCYRSRFLRDLCIDPSLTQLMCDIYQTDVAPHTMPLHLGHMNFSPDKLEDAVDKWHHDTLPLDTVMMVTDPATLEGGEFEYFLGTRTEMAALAEMGKQPPRDRVVQPVFNGPGYAIALHGNMVVHRGAPLKKTAERISMVNGYVATNTRFDDQHRHRDLTLIDPPELLYAEWAKHAAWRTRGKLETLISELPFSDDRLQIANELEATLVDIQQTIADLRDTSAHEMHHYEKH
jgi:hypothetical protein